MPRWEAGGSPWDVLCRRRSETHVGHAEREARPRGAFVETA